MRVGHKSRVIKDFSSISTFQKKIAENLANHSASIEDEFILIGYHHNYQEFDCELCGHQHCVREFIIKNVQTEEIMSIGSECIHHFEGRGIDIDLAFGLMKRIEKATAEARNDAKMKLGLEAWEKLTTEERTKLYRYYREGSDWVPDSVIEELGKAAFKNLSKEEKNRITIEAFVVYQAKQLLLDMKYKNAVLTEEQVEDILNLGFGDEYEEAKKKQEEKNIQKKKDEFMNGFDNIIHNYKIDMNEDQKKQHAEDFEKLIEKIIEKRIELGFEESILSELRKEYEDAIAYHNERRFVLDYEGNNSIIKDMAAFYRSHRRLSENQISFAHSIIVNEAKEKDIDFENKLNWLFENEDNSFVKSVSHQYNQKGYISDKQKEAIEKIYKKVTSK